MSRISKLTTWLNNEIEKDNKDLELEKTKFIKEISKIKKEQIFKKEKYSFWSRLKKVLFEK